MRIHLSVPGEGEKDLFDSDGQIHDQFSKRGQDNALGAQEFDAALDKAFLEIVGNMERHPQTKACLKLPDGKKLEIKLIR